MNEIIVDKNDEILWNYFMYQNPLAKYLVRAKQSKND